MKKINVFVNDKLISCDTIVPLTLHIKKKYPEIKITYYTLNFKTYVQVKKNVNLYNLLCLHSDFVLLGWVNLKGYLSKFFKLIHIFNIIKDAFFKKVTNIHFKALGSFPFNLIYFFNKKNTYLFESNAWGTNKNILFADYVFDKRNVKNFPAFKSFDTLVAFDKSWHQINKAKKKKVYIVHSTKFLDSWQVYVKNEALNELRKNPKWYNKKNKYIIYVLGALDHSMSSIDKAYSGEMLLNKTLEVIINHTNYHVLLKPHVITDLQILNNNFFIKKNKKRLHIVYNHLAVLSQITNLVIGNYFSQSMPDAWINGAKIIEFSKYDTKVLKFCNNNSVAPFYVDTFINYNITKLKEELNKKVIRLKRNITLNDKASMNELLEKITFIK